MISKIHISNNKVIISICDEALLGNVYEENGFVLDLRSNFYKGEKRDNAELLKHLKTCQIINAVGKNSVGFLIENKMIKEENLSYIMNVPFVQLIFS